MPQESLFSPLSDVDFVRHMLADLHDDLEGKLGRYRQLADLSMGLGEYGTMLPSGETAFALWAEARSSFVHGNFVATVLLCQGLAEHVLAGRLAMGEQLPPRVAFQETLRRSLERGFLGESLVEDLRRLMSSRNPLSHYRGLDDDAHLARRAIESGLAVHEHLQADATFAISVAVRLLSLPGFRVDGGSLTG